MVGGDVKISVSDSVNFANIFNHAGTSVSGAGFELSESVPEPASMALLGIGMAGFFAFRRIFKRANA